MTPTGMNTGEISRLDEESIWITGLDCRGERDEESETIKINDITLVQF